MKNPLLLRPAAALLVVLAVFPAAAHAAITLAADTLADGNRSNEVLPGSLQWFTYGSSDVSVTAGSLTLFTGGSSAVSLAAKIPAATLANVGDTLTLTYQFQVPANAASSGGAYAPLDQFGVRAGLFNSNGAAVTVDGSSGAGTQGQVAALGYAAMMSPSPAPGADAITLRRRDGASGALITALTGVFANVSTGRVTTGTSQALAVDTTYTGTFTLTVTGASTIKITSDITGGTFASAHYNATVDDSLQSSSYRTFDMIGFGIGTSGGVPATGGITIKSVQVTFSNAGASAPTVATAPADQSVVPGGDAMFTVVAGGSGPFGYQWQKDGVDLAGATAATLTVANVSAGDVGNYTAIVSNAGGSATSSAAALTLAAVVEPPVITTDPASSAVIPGQSVTLSVAAGGTAPFTYQWNKAGNPISGATDATFTIATFQASDAGGYTVTLTNSAGSATSGAGVLSVSSAAVAPSITTQPVTTGALAGGTVSLTVGATGTDPLTYQWSKGGVAIGGATLATLTLSNLQAVDAADYTVTITNSAGSVTSDPVHVSLVLPGRSITLAQLTQTEDFNHAYTTSASAVSLPWADSTTIDGWYVYQNAAGTPTNVTTQAALNGSSSGAIYLIADASAPDNFALTARVSDANGSAPSVPGSGYYFALKLTNNTGDTIHQFSLGYTGLQFYRSTGSSNNTIRPSFKVAAAGTLPAITSGTWTDISALIFTAPQNSTDGTSASILNFNAGNFVDFAPVSVSGVDWAAGTDLWIRWWIDNVPSTDQGVGIDNVTFAAASPLGPYVSTQPVSTTVAAGHALSLTAAAGGPGTFTYQWSKNGVAIPGATAATLTITQTQPADAGRYQVSVANSAATVTSDTAVITVIAPGREITASQLTYTEDFNHAYTTLDTPTDLPWTDNSTVPGWYLWMNAAGLPATVTTQNSLTGTNAGPIYLLAAGTATDNFALATRVVDANASAPTTAGNGYYFALKLTNHSGGTITEFSLGYTGLQFYRSTGLANNEVTLAYQIDAGGSATAITGGSWTDIPELGFIAPFNGVDGQAAATTNFNTDGNFVNYAPVTVSGLNWRQGEDLWIRWRVSNVAGIDQGVGIDNVAFTAAAPTGPFVPTLTASPTSTSVSAGDALTLSVTATGTGPFTYQWLKDGDEIAGATEATLTLTNFDASAAGKYSVAVTNSAGTVTSSAATVWLNAGHSYIANLSIRATAGTGDNVLIAGFVVADGTKTVLAQSPTLARFGVSGSLEDPQIALYSGSDLTVANNDWDTAVNAADVADAIQILGATNLPAGGKDSAVLAELAAGPYTAQVSGVGNTAGVSIAAVFDAGGGGRLSNVSGRCQTGTGDNIIIGGFVIAGSEPKQMLLRGVGPTLATYGVQGVLNDPQITLYQTLNGVSSVVDANDNWDANPTTGAQIAAVAARVGAFPLPPGSKDGALLVVLQPGVYTLQLSGVGDTTGVALIEIYDAQ